MIGVRIGGDSSVTSRVQMTSLIYKTPKLTDSLSLCNTNYGLWEYIR